MLQTSLSKCSLWATSASNLQGRILPRLQADCSWKLKERRSRYPQRWPSVLQSLRSMCFPATFPVFQLLHDRSLATIFENKSKLGRKLISSSTFLFERVQDNVEAFCATVSKRTVDLRILAGDSSVWQNIILKETKRQFFECSCILQRFCVERLHSFCEHTECCPHDPWYSFADAVLQWPCRIVSILPSLISHTTWLLRWAASRPGLQDQVLGAWQTELPYLHNQTDG